MILSFEPKTDRQRRAWVRWCEVEHDEAWKQYLEVLNQSHRSKRRQRVADRYYDAAERLYNAEDDDHIPDDPYGPPAG